jgi:hypothetical protein
MKLSRLAAGIGLLVCLPAIGYAADTAPPNYLSYVEKFADTLLSKGLDNYGPKKTPMWAAVIDTQTLTVPEKDVPTPPGVRPGDRAVGGSNLYHDVVTLQTFRVLSAVTGNPRYENAARDYLKAYLENAQSPQTGLLAWGEHTYYDLFTDKGTVAPEYQNKSYGDRWHELIAWTAPWEQLWAIDPEWTKRAIAGIRYHFHSPDTTTFLFNRHAYWDQARYQKPEGSQPWIKHTGLYTHAFLFLYARTKDPEWLRWARGTGSLYWDHRNPKTDLTLGCIGDPRPSTQDASLGGTASLSYWLLKAYQAYPQEKALRDRALTLIKAYDRHGYDKKRDGYYASLRLDGTPAGDLTPTWASGYGEGSLTKFGRMAAYIARVEKDADCLLMARRVARCARRDPLPPNYVVESIAYALGLSLDLYDLTGEKAYLTDAKRYADLAVDKFWSNGLFTRQTGDRYYEAKLGTGDLVAGLLRLHLRLHPEIKDPGVYDWSF